MDENGYPRRQKSSNKNLSERYNVPLFELLVSVVHYNHLILQSIGNFLGYSTELVRHYC